MGAARPGWQVWTRHTLLPRGRLMTKADYGEALVLGHGNNTHVPCADSPWFDPDTF